jgi:DNA-binding response OmpR family regulator
MLGANSLVRDNLLVLLRAMGCHCVIAPRLPEALALLEREKPDAAILDPQADSSPGAMVAAFHRRFPDLRDRTIVLTGGETAPDVLKVLDAYSLPRVPLHRLLQELWPCLDWLLTRNIVSEQVTSNARLIFDSFLQQPADIRNSRSVIHRVLYESEGLMADLSVEPERDSQRVTLVGQVLDTAGREPQLDSVPVVLHGQTELLGVAKTNEFGEFHFDFDSEPGVTLEIGVKGHHWVLLDVPDTKETRAEITYESQLPAQSKLHSSERPISRVMGKGVKP